MTEVERPRYRYIPFRKKDILEMCLRDGGLGEDQHDQFRAFSKLLASVFHYEFHDHLERLKDLYAPVNPDRDTRRLEGAAGNEPPERFTAELEALLNKANYESLGRAELEAAFRESSLFQLKLDIDLDEFEEVLLYTRGEKLQSETLQLFFGLITREVTFSNFDRVVICIRFRADADAADVVPGRTLLKLFQNVPKADVEMLFPNTRIGMRVMDKLLIGVPALAGAVAIATTKAGASLLLLATLIGFWLGLRTESVELSQAELVAVLAGLGGLGSYVWKQFSNFRNRKLMFMQSLTRNLYFRNLDNNAGVFHRLMDEAEEEECKEALLAYYFLTTGGTRFTRQALDEHIESWFAESWSAYLDFEIGDALEKLFTLGLAREVDNTIEVVSLEEACRRLDQRWDQYFSYNS